MTDALRVEPTLARARAQIRERQTAEGLLALSMELHRQIVEKGREMRELERLNRLDPRPQRKPVRAAPSADAAVNSLLGRGEPASRAVSA